MNTDCANDELSQPKGSTNEELRVCQSSLSQERGSPQHHVPNVPQGALHCDFPQHQAEQISCGDLTDLLYQVEC